ncbi:MAG: glycosyltransferase [Pseudomonadota bacterium]
METAWIVIPCFNEADRLDEASVVTLLNDSRVSLVFVDDGSTDATLDYLRDLQATHKGRIEVLVQPENLGKAAAVQRGMNHAWALGATVTGYLDADFATPAAEMLRLLSTLTDHPDVEVLIGSRWLHLGANIQRSNLRHYFGRIFATLASLTLRMGVYDTQCGAKLFRVTDAFVAAIKDPFVSRWAFDVELLGRLDRGLAGQPGLPREAFLEEPLLAWHDVRGSKIRLVDMIMATLELILIHGRLRG